MVKTIRARRGLRLLTRNPRIEVFAHGWKHEMLAGNVAVEIGHHSLRLPRRHSPSRRSFPLVRDLLRLLSVCLFRASLNAPTIRQRHASEPEFRACSLSYASHADNNTDNIHACPELFSVVRLRGKGRLLLGALANQGFESPCLQSSLAS